MHGPAAEALLEGTKYDAETEDMAGSSEAAAAAGVRPPRPNNRSAPTKKQKKNWHRGVHPTRRFTFGPHGTPAAAGAAGSAGAAGAAEDWQMGNAGAEAAATAAGRASEDIAGAVADARTEEASGVTTAGAAGAAEVPGKWATRARSAEAATTATTATGGAVATGSKAAAEAESVTHGAPSGQRPKPANWWGSMTKAQR